jgi:hypothetical protein
MAEPTELEPATSFELSPDTRYLNAKGKKTDRLFLEGNLNQRYVVIYCDRCKTALRICHEKNEHCS